MLKSYKELVVWQKSIDLVKEIYRLTKKFPKTEIFGIIPQMRRAAISIPSNIAEGCGRTTRKEYRHFYSISYGSALELETQMLLSKDLSLAQTQDFIAAENLLDEILKMLNVITRKLAVTSP